MVSSSLPAFSASSTLLEEQFANFLRRHLAALGQLAYFGGHHGKAFAVLAGAGGLDGGVEREQIGLIGNVVDDADALGDLFHRRHCLLHRFTTFGGLLGGLAGHAVGDFGVLGVLIDAGAHLLDGGAGLLHAGGLFRWSPGSSIGQWR